MGTIGSDSFKAVIAFVLAGGAFFAIWANFYSSSARQRQNLAIADNFSRTTLTPLFRRYKEFKRIRAYSYSGSGGCISISGVVKTRSELKRLQRLVRQARPPLQIRWSVLVEEGIFESAKKSERIGPPATSPAPRESCR